MNLLVCYGIVEMIAKLQDLLSTGICDVFEIKLIDMKTYELAVYYIYASS